jgi:hypothetical protein
MTMAGWDVARRVETVANFMVGLKVKGWRLKVSSQYVTFDLESSTTDFLVVPVPSRWIRTVP